MEKLCKKLSSFLFPLSSCIGFTLIELLTIIGIMSILATILFTSQYTIREQIFLFQDQYKISNVINEAKNLTLGAFMRDKSVCGYGASFEQPGKVILYKDKKYSGDYDPNKTDLNNRNCIDITGHTFGFDPGVDEINKESSFDLNKTERFEFGDVSEYGVAFNAPSLRTFLIKNNENLPDTDNNIIITLQAIKSGSELKITINQFGQVSTK